VQKINIYSYLTTVGINGIEPIYSVRFADALSPLQTGNHLRVCREIPHLGSFYEVSEW
jgi:hypothetical protein